MNKLQRLILLSVFAFLPLFLNSCVTTILIGTVLMIDHVCFHTESDGGTCGEIVYRIDFTHPDEAVKASYLTKYNLYTERPITPNRVMRLDDDIIEAMRKMEEMEQIVRSLPGYDCGSCGSPTCRTFAEDIVRGFATKMDCIHVLKDQLKIMAQKMVELSNTNRE